MLSSPLQTRCYVKEFKSDKSQISSTFFTGLHCGFLLPHADGNTVIDVSFRSFVCIRHWLEVAAWCTATGSGSSIKQGYKTVQYTERLDNCGFYTYRTVVTICTTQRSVYVPHSGHYMYRTVVTICTVQWSPYIPPGLTFSSSTFYPQSVFLCFVWISEQTAIISLYNINWLVFITETVCLLRGTDWVVKYKSR